MKSLNSIYGDYLCVGVHVAKIANKFYNQIKFDIFQELMSLLICVIYEKKSDSPSRTLMIKKFNIQWFYKT